MQTDNNGRDNNKRELEEQQSNKAATENMDANQEKQNQKYQQDRNDLTQSGGHAADGESLANDKRERDTSPDSLSVKEQNRNKQDAEKDADFGGEDLI